MNITNVIKGFFIGIALVIPGLSGSIFAVVVGLYEKILDAINNFSKDMKGSIHFLLPVGIGAVIGILASTKVILWICENYSLQSYLFFIGLVLGSVPLVIKKINKIKFNPLYPLLTVVCFVAILCITELGAEGEKSYIALQTMDSFDDVLTMAFAGVFSVSLMAIPGVSGSIMLMVINQYGTVYNAVGSCVDLMGYLLKGNVDMAAEAFKTVLLIVPFLAGALIGIIFIAKIMGFLLKKYESLVYYCVAGVILGAIVTLAKEGVIGNINASSGIITWVYGAALVAIGILCTIFLDKPQND